MVVLLIVFAPVVFAVAGWSWRYQQHVLRVAGAGVARVAGHPGVVADVQITSVLVDGSRALIGFRPAGLPRDAESTRQSLLVSLDANAPATVARLRRWEAGAGPVVMWRDRAGGRIELSQMRTGQQVILGVIPEPAAVAAVVA